MNQIFISLGFLLLLGAGDSKITSASSSNGGQFDDIHMSTAEIIQKYGYPAETHEAVTEDGYIIEIQRIPHGKNSSKPGIPILLMHGLLADSSMFLSFELNSPGFLLSDAGYDVWFGNLRGNRYTRLEKNLGLIGNKFWDYSFSIRWHEMGVYDLPAQINYVSNYTQFDKILYIGYSMGTTSFFVMASERPEYQNKIRGAFMLAPVAYLKHSTSPARNFMPSLLVLREPLTHAKLLPSQIVNEYCNKGVPLQTNVCKTSLFRYGGNDPEEFNENASRGSFGYFVGDVSIKAAIHYLQLMKSGGFLQYDYGRIKNVAKYSQSSPPEYNLEAITTPMSLFLGLNDFYVDPRDVASLLGRLSCVRTVDAAPHKEFSHIDFVVAKHAKEFLYDKLLERIKNFLEEDSPQTSPKNKSDKLKQ